MAEKYDVRCDSQHHIMDQATSTAQFYLGRAREDIDREFGPGYAAAHPELVGAYMQAAASDDLASQINIHGQNTRNAITHLGEYLSLLGDRHEQF